MARKKKTKVHFYASGYGSKTYTYNSYEEAVDATEEDVKNTAAEHNGEWTENGNEYTVTTRDGEEIARWEIDI